MTDVFLSYSRADKATAVQLVKALEAQGWNVFWDTEIPPGRKWSDYIQEKIDEARCVLAIWSPTSIMSDWVLEEARRSKGKLVAASIGGALPPFGFGGLQFEDLRPWLNRESLDGFKRLLSAIAEKVGSDTPIHNVEAAFWGPRRVAQLRYGLSLAALSTAISLALQIAVPLAREGMAWSTAAVEHSLEGYAAFLDSFPAGRHASDAARRAQEIARSQEMTSAITEFIRAYLSTPASGMAAFVSRNFADKVIFMNRGEITNTRVIEEKRDYFSRWPGNEFALEPSSLTIIDYKLRERTYLVRYSYQYEVWNKTRTLCGSAGMAMDLMRSGSSDLKVAREVQSHLWQRNDCKPRHLE